MKLLILIPLYLALQTFLWIVDHRKLVVHSYPLPVRRNRTLPARHY